MSRCSMNILAWLVLLLANPLIINSLEQKEHHPKKVPSVQASKANQFRRAPRASQCPPNCFNNTCNQGTCSSCIARQSGPTCDTTCTLEHCAHCDQAEPGRCLRCVAGWTGTCCECNSRCRDTCVGSCNDQGRCFQCVKGRWSTEACMSECPPGCHGHCDMHSGTCFKCKPGKFTPVCQTDCPERCRHKVCGMSSPVCSLGCEDGWWGAVCDRPCSPNCVEPGYCDRNDGSCNCKEGFHGDSCTLPCTNCGERGQCNHIGVCDECSDGFYSRECNVRCPDSCATCDRWNGECTRCKANDKWGLEGCNRQCDARCQVDNTETCNINTGKCNYCPPGYCGDRCQDRCQQSATRKTHGCPKGYFGPLCTSKCSEKCLGKLCQKETGKCLKCRPGWTGASCGERCPDNIRCNGSTDIKLPGTSQGRGPKDSKKMKGQIEHDMNDVE